MVQNVEGLQPKGHGQPLIDRKYPGDLCIKLVVRVAAVGVSADIAIRPIGGTRRGDLREGRRVQVCPVRSAARGPARYVEIGRNSAGQIRAIVANISERVVLTRGHSEWRSTDDMHQRRELPVVEEERLDARKVELTLGNNHDVFDVPVVGTARAVVAPGVVGVLNGGAGYIAGRILDVETLGTRCS